MYWVTFGEIPILPGNEGREGATTRPTHKARVQPLQCASELRGSRGVTKPGLQDALNEGNRLCSSVRFTTIDHRAVLGELRKIAQLGQERLRSTKELPLRARDSKTKQLVNVHDPNFRESSKVTKFDAGAFIEVVGGSPSRRSASGLR